MSNLQTILIEDSRISNITDQEVYSVMSGPSQNTFQEFVANSTSSSSIIFNCQIPSENIVIDRHLLIQSTVTLTLNLKAINVSNQTKLAFNLGLSDSLQAFPINSLCQSQMCTINNVSISQNTKDILPMILRMYDKRKLNRYNSICPSLPDSYYAEYIDGYGTLNNVLAGYNNQSLDEDFTPRGGFDTQILQVLHTYNTVTTETTTNSDGTKTTAITSTVAGTPDNSLVMPAGVPPADTAATTYTSEYTDNTFVIVLQFTSTEPFIALSPFTNSFGNNTAGLCGINTISLNLSIDSTCKRVFSTMNNYIQSISLGGTVGTNYIQPFINTKLLFNFLSLQPEQYQKISSRNTIPYLDFPRFLSVANATSSIPSKGSSTLTSNNLQLSMIPDLILITVRKPMVDQNWADSSSFLTIKKISINFNNSSGLLSSANSQQLYLMSYKNGSGQSYYEFNGYANNNYTGAKFIDGSGDSVSEGTTADKVNLIGKGSQVGTTGSMLVISPTDLSLPSYLAPGSLGQFNLTFNIDVYNQFTSAITPEICVITVNSGFFSTQLGSSVITTGILTKEEVLRAKEKKSEIDSNDYKRYIGGSLHNMGMSNVMKLFKKKFINDDKLEEPAMASGLSGGSVSAGRIQRLSKHIR